MTPPLFRWSPGSACAVSSLVSVEPFCFSPWCHFLGQSCLCKTELTSRWHRCLLAWQCRSPMVGLTTVHPNTQPVLAPRVVCSSCFPGCSSYTADSDFSFKAQLTCCSPPASRPPQSPATALQHLFLQSVPLPLRPMRSSRAQAASLHFCAFKT